MAFGPLGSAFPDVKAPSCTSSHVYVYFHEHHSYGLASLLSLLFFQNGNNWDVFFFIKAIHGHDDIVK